MAEVLKVVRKNEELAQSEISYKPNELSMVRPLSNEEIKEKFKLQKDLIVDEFNQSTMYWINHLGDKFVTVEIKSEEKEDKMRGTIVTNCYIFRLYNSEFI
jgi:hypothetical protein